jgi:polar amino acid transport system permease protein
VALFVISALVIIPSDRYRDILLNLINDPQVTTQDKFDVVYEVDVPVTILSETVFIKLADGSRLQVPASDIDSRAEGTLVCDKQADPACLDEFGQLVSFRRPLLEGETADGFWQRFGLQRPIPNTIEQANGELLVITPEQVISTQEDGVLECDRVADVACQDKAGTIVTYQVPYKLDQGLLTRDDVLIRHEDGYQETVRPNRLRGIEVQACERAENPYCQSGQVLVADFRERVIGVETGRDGDSLQIRTVDEVTVLIPRAQILSLETGPVACDREANPRCQDFEGTIVQRAGAVITGELTVETNRNVNIIPDGQSTAVEISKDSLVSDTRTPADCRVEDEGACQIEIRQADDVVAGRIMEDSEAGLLVQTVAPVVREIDRDSATSTRRAPLTCALNNIQGCNKGLWLTLLVTVVSYGLALVIGLILGLMRVSKNPILFHVATFYVELVRGTPLLVLLLFFAFVVGPALRDSPIPLVGEFYDLINQVEVAILGEESLLAEAVLGLAMGYGAFLAEVFRAGIESIGRGQMEAARSLGMNYILAMRKVILPQAIRLVLPPLGNDFIAMLKDSALISVLALPDMLQMGRLYISRTFQPIPVYVIVALLYILLTMLLSLGVRALERRMRLPGS